MSESTDKRRKGYVDHPKDRYKGLVSYMSLGIHQMNARSWETFVISILKSFLLRTAVTIPQLEINLADRKIKIVFLIMQWMRSSYKEIIK